MDLEVRTHPTFLESLISKYDFGSVKLPGLSRNGPQVISLHPYNSVEHWTGQTEMHFPAIAHRSVSRLVKALLPFCLSRIAL